MYSCDSYKQTDPVILQQELRYGTKGTWTKGSTIIAIRGSSVSRKLRPDC
jgi:hypothetical protein